jgi:hypothetical protein
MKILSALIDRFVGARGRLTGLASAAILGVLKDGLCRRDRSSTLEILDEGPPAQIQETIQAIYTAKLRKGL